MILLARKRDVLQALAKKDNEPAGFIKFGKFLDSLSVTLAYEKGCAP
jgi:hypothetical protein